MKINRGEITEFRQAMLAWYDRHKRDLPWRTREGERNDPYKIWLSEIMLQQTTVAAVIPYFLKFIKKWPTIHDLAGADDLDVMQNWAGLGYYARARNLLKCAREVSGIYDGEFPDNIEALKKLPGIGDYTSASITAIAFNKEANVVDGNVERVMARIHALKEPLPVAKIKLKQLAALYSAEQHERTGDYAQSLMDLGATICTPQKPLCALCPVNGFCKAYKLGIAENLPLKKANKEKPKKIGTVFWIENDKKQILIEIRPNKGLLAGMCGFPSTSWRESDSIITDEQPERLEITEIKHTKQIIHHSFTHFDLGLKLAYGKTCSEFHKTEHTPFRWIDRNNINEIGFPTVFKKALRVFVSNK